MCNMLTTATSSVGPVLYSPRTLWLVKNELTQLVAVVNMLHMLSYGQQGGGGCDNVLGE